MRKSFNTTGPCAAERHYMLPPQARLPELRAIVEDGQYFVIHAARQTGKTTLILDLERELNAQGVCRAFYCNLEPASGIAGAKEGIPIIVQRLIKSVQDNSFECPALAKLDLSNYGNVLNLALSRLAKAIAKPLVVLFDEVDSLENGTLIGVLRQLRDGYITRSKIPFPHSIALVGMRNIRDYKARVRDDQNTLGSASPFNIVAETMTLRNFTRHEVAQLYGQHTAATGQSFPEAVSDAAFQRTQGQPWLVNAIAREITAKILGNDHSAVIRPEMVDQAAEAIILRRDAHIDSLLERLKEERVRRVIEPIVIGKEGAMDRLSDDYSYVSDLGLIRDDQGAAEPANPIYAEVIVRTLSWNAQQRMSETRTSRALEEYRRADGGLDMGVLLKDFQGFWRENGEIWLERFEYKEAAPHLVLMAFLQRVLNGGGRITREMAAGRRRLDLCVELDGRRYPIELKLRHDANAETEGVRQLAQYMDGLGCVEGWLLVFDRRPVVPWEQKIFTREVRENLRAIHILGC